MRDAYIRYQTVFLLLLLVRLLLYLLLSKISMLEEMCRLLFNKGAICVSIYVWVNM